MRARRAHWLALAAVLSASCGSDSDAPRSAPAEPAKTDDLPPGVAARVADQNIEVDLVRRVAGAQNLSPLAARERLVSSALLAAHAREELAPTGLVQVAERAGLARAMLERIERESLAEGPPSDSEIATVAEARWLDVDRPAAARTSHAVVLVKEGTSPAAARALATRIADAARGITDAEKFRERAKSVPKGELDVRVEQLGPVTADGRVIPDRPTSGPPARMDARFAAAANAIANVGEQSTVVESSFGFHVILLEERMAEQRLSQERKREVLRDEALAMRMRKREQELLERLRRTTRIEHDRAASALTAEVRVRP